VRVRFGVGAIVTVLLAAAAWANWNDTSTGMDLTSLPAFPLTKVRSGLLGNNARVQFDGFVAMMRGPADGPAVDEAVLSGTGKSGKRWAVHFPLVAFDQVYRGDLDGNGTPDYVVIGASPYWNGRLAPPGRIIVLLLDQQGLPVPFEAPLYDDLGPRHVVDVLHDGRARLALAAYDENGWDNRSSVFCSGHWITDLFEPAGLNWQGFQGTAGGTTFPFVHRWTYWPDCNDPPPEPWKEVIRTGQYSTASADITSVRIAEGDTLAVKLIPPSVCEGVSIGSVVYDQHSRREVALVANTEYRAELVARIQAEKADVTLRGVYRSPDGRSCRANLLWASK
jgi:hypothetical protein